MQNKKVVAIVGVLALILLFGLSAILRGKSKTSGELVGKNITTESQESKNGALTTLKDLLAGGKDQKCNWSFTDGKQTIDGTILISGKAFRQETKMNDPTTGKEVQMFSISDGEYMYIWNSSNLEQGVKTKITEAETETTNIETGDTQVQGKLDWEKEYEYKCENWTVNAADLTPPSEITFVDMEAQLKQLQDLQNKFGGEMEIPETEN